MATPITRATLAAALAGFSGLDYHVALNWLNAENSVAGNGTNPLGILAGNSAGSGLEVGSSGRFAVYRSALDGVKAAAWLLAHGSHYPAVRTAIATGTPAQQRAAIVGSGWAAGNYHGGTSFSSAGISGTASSLAGSDMSAASITPTAAIAASAGIDAGASGTGVTASAPFIDIPDGKVLTYQDMLHIVFLYGAAGAFDGIGGNNARATLMDILGAAVKAKRIWGPDLRDELQAQIQGAAADAGSFGVWGWLPGLAVNLAILGAILVLGYRGVREIVG